MGFLFGNSNSSSDSMAQNEARINAISYEQSTYGAVKNVVYGTNRICGNIIDSVDFTAIGHTTTAAASGKGGQEQSSTSYTYKARVAIGLCYGPIQGINRVILDDTNYSLSDKSLSLFTGTSNQSAWGEMLTYHSERALKYRNLAYVAGYIDLTSSAGVPQFNFEVNGLYTANTDDLTPIITEGFNFTTSSGTLGTVSGVMEYSSYYKSDDNVEVIYYDSDGIGHTIENFTNYSRSGATYTFYLSSLGAVSAHVYVTYNSKVRLDANPKDIIYDALTNEIFGANYPSEKIGDFSDYSKYCIANNLFLSPVYDSQEEVQDILSDLATITNSAFVPSQDKLKLIPLGDEEVTGNGVTWTPDLTPIYDLTEDDFIKNYSGDESVICTRSQQSDVYNSVKIEFLNRANNYNTEIAEAQDLANIELFGFRPADTQTAHQICTAEVAQKTAQLALDRNIAVRNTYKFKLPINYILLEAMDIVTLTYKNLGLERELVRIKTIKEDDGELEFEVEELVAGTASPARIQTQHNNCEKINYAQSVGNVNPVVIFEPPMELTQETLETWIGISSEENLFGGGQIWISDDGETYKLQGDITSALRQGILSKALAASNSEIDTANKLYADLSMSKAEILSGTQSDADNLNTLCYCDGELLAYETATLTGSYQYELSYLVRGAYSSEISAHDKGKQFCRVDKTAFLKVPFSKDDIGKTIYIKCPTYNTFGSGLQSLADVEPYYYTIQGTALKEAPEDITGLTDYYTDGLSVITWNAVDDTRTIVYEVRKSTNANATWEQIQSLGRVSANKFTANGNGTYFIKAYAPDYNVYSETAASIEISGARLTQNVIATNDEQIAGWVGTLTDVVTYEKNIRLASTGMFDDIPDFDSINDLNFYGDVAISGIYEAADEVDIGAAASCYINVDFNFIGDSKDNAIDTVDDFDSIQDFDGNYGSYISGSKIQISIAGDDNIFAGWKDFITGQYYGKKFKFRAILQTTSSKVFCEMSQFTISVDVPDIVETGNSISIPVAGTTIASAKNFHAIPNTQITILNKQNGDYEVLSNETADGFTIQIMNGGSGVTRSINYVRQGY